MKQAHLSAFLVFAFAALLVAGPAIALAVTEDPAAVGKVTAFETGKSITVGEGDAKKEFKIDDKTEVASEVAVGKEVKVWAKDGVATKISIKE
jgi:hypothetical protein